MALFASTSPSWLILRSLDRCNEYLRSGYRERLADYTGKISALKERLRLRGFETAGDESLKLTLAPKGFGWIGTELENRLREENIVCEFSDPDFLVMMLTPENGEEGLQRLESALNRVPRREPVRTKPPAPPAPDPAMPFAEALLSPAERVPVRKSLGRILADPCVSCPPAVPIVVSGERIGAEAVRCFEYYGIREISCVL